MFCTNCGASLPDGAALCPQCGAAVEEAVAQDLEKTAESFTEPRYQAPDQPVNQEAAQPQYQAPVYQEAAQPQYQAPVYQEAAQPQYQAPVYQAPTQPSYHETAQQPNLLIFGILSIVLACFTGIGGIILGAIGRSKGKAYALSGGRQLTGTAKVGFILSLVGLILGIVMTVVYAIIFIAAAAAGGSSSYYYYY